MQQPKFNLDDTVYFFAQSKQESFVDRFNFIPVEGDPYKKLINKVKVNAVHVYQGKPTRYDVRSNSHDWWDGIYEDCLYGSYDEAKTVLQELISKRIKELAACYLSDK